MNPIDSVAVTWTLTSEPASIVAPSAVASAVSVHVESATAYVAPSGSIPNRDAPATAKMLSNVPDACPLMIAV